MPHGRQIRILLDDGTVTGVRYAEVVNWTGQALVCPRSLIGKLKDWREAGRPGVYLLFGISEETDEEIVYIGEAENGLVRIIRHLSEKDFWREAILFTNKDSNLQKSHVKYLEARIYQLARIAGRYGLDNSNEPQKPVLSRGDEQAMEEFIDNIRLLLGALGYRLLEPVTSRRLGADMPPNQTRGSIEQQWVPLASERETELLYLKTKNTDATGLRTYEGFVVLNGSKLAQEVNPSLQPRYRMLREQLLNEGVIVLSDGGLVFTRDYLFSTPTKAASVLTGVSIGGRTAWKTENGIPLSELEKAPW